MTADPVELSRAILLFIFIVAVLVYVYDRRDQ